MIKGYNYECYCIQKRVALKCLEDAKALRGTTEHKTFCKRAHRELSHATFIAEAIGIINR